MNREEEREKAARIRANQYSHPVEWNDCYKHWIEGAEWADAHPINYDGKAMLHVLDKGVEIGKKQAFEKVNEFLNTFNIDDYISIIISGCCGITFMREKFIEDLKKTLQDENR